MISPKEMDDIEAPKTVKEVGIHLVYLRRDIANLAKIVEESAKNYATKAELEAVKEDIIKNYVPKSEHDKLAARVTPILWLGAVAGTAIIGTIATAIVAFMLNGGFGNGK